MTPSERLRRALHEAADALADLAEERAESTPRRVPKAKAPATVPNNDMAAAYAQRELGRQGWPTPKRAG